MSFQVSDSDEGEAEDINLDSDDGDIPSPAAVSEEEDEEEDRLDTARMELPEYEEDLPPIMAEIQERKRQQHAAVSAYNRQDLESVASDYALPSATPRSLQKQQTTNNDFEDSLLAGFEMPPDPVVGTTQKQKQHQEVFLQQDQLVDREQAIDQNTKEGVTSGIVDIDSSGVHHRANAAIEKTKKHAQIMQDEFDEKKNAAAKRIQHRIRKRQEKKNAAAKCIQGRIRKKQARQKNAQTKAAGQKVNVDIKGKEQQEKKIADTQKIESRIDHEMELEKVHEAELTELVDHERLQAHDRVQQRLQRKKSLVKTAHEKQSGTFGEKTKEDLEQELLSADQVRKRLEKELSQLRLEFSEKNERALTSKDEETANLRLELATKESKKQELLPPNEVQELREHLQHMSAEKKRLHIKLEEQTEAMKKMEETHHRKVNTLQLRMKIVQKNNNAGEEAKRDRNELASKNDMISELQDTIFALREANRRFRTATMDQNKMSGQLGRAEKLLHQERRKRSKQFVVVHVGSEIPSESHSHLLRMTQLHDATHVLRKNVIFEMAANSMLEDCVGHDTGTPTTTNTGLPTDHSMCGALMAGQHLRLGTVYGGWACLEAPFQGSWINIGALGPDGLTAIGDGEDVVRAVAVGDQEENIGSYRKDRKTTMDGQERKISRDRAAELIHQVMAMEKVVAEGTRLLERSLVGARQQLRERSRGEHAHSSTKKVGTTDSAVNRRTLQHFRNLFDEVSTELGDPAARARFLEDGNTAPSQRKNSGLNGGDWRLSSSVPLLQVGVASSSITPKALAATGRDSWLRKQEQAGVWAVPPLELAKRKRARKQAKKKSDAYMHSSAGTSEKLLHLFARLHTAATRVERDDKAAATSSHMLTWINSRLPRRVFYVFTKDSKDSKDSKMEKNGKSAARMSRRGVPEVGVTVYHFPLDGDPADMEAGTKIFQGQTSDDGKVTCRVSPGCYMVVVSVLTRESRRLMLVDPARGHLEKRSVVVPIEV